MSADLRAVQKPLKQRYRDEPGSSRITLTASGSETATPLSCSVDIGRAVYAAEAHAGGGGGGGGVRSGGAVGGAGAQGGVGGVGAAACSGDLLLGALAACAQITCQMVATAMKVPTESIEAVAEGDFDLAGTLGISEDVPVGFENKI